MAVKTIAIDGYKNHITLELYDPYPFVDENEPTYVINDKKVCNDAKKKYGLMRKPTRILTNNIDSAIKIISSNTNQNIRNTKIIIYVGEKTFMSFVNSVA
jgi:hypothetical protein